jgi:hypothetical protein
MTIKRVVGGRTLVRYQNYWYVVLNKSELQEYPGCHWHGYVIYHKWKYWHHYGEHYWRDEAVYRYNDGNPDNLRVTNIVVKLRGTSEWF